MPIMLSICVYVTLVDEFSLDLTLTTNEEVSIEEFGKIKRWFDLLWSTVKFCVNKRPSKTSISLKNAILFLTATVISSGIEKI